MLVANKDWDIKETAGVLSVCILVNASCCWCPSTQPEQLLQQLKFLMANTQCTWDLLNLLVNETHRFFPVQYRLGGSCLHKWQSKSSESTTMQRNLESVALMKVVLSSGWILPGSEECGSWLPRHSVPLSPPSTAILALHPALLAIYKHPSLSAFAGETRVDVQTRYLQCRRGMASSLWAGWDLCHLLFGSSLSYLKKTTLPFNFLSLMGVIFSKVFFTVICTFILSSSWGTPTVSEVLTEKSLQKMLQASK